MIKLAELIKEAPKQEYPPYMYSPVGFSCHVCKYHYEDEGVHKCSNEHYHAYIKETYPKVEDTSLLVDTKGDPIKDPTKWCSNWFTPKVAE